MKTVKGLLKSIFSPKALGKWRRLKWWIKPPERELLWLSKIIQTCQLKGDFVDIGAHLGLYSIMSSKIFNSILAIEANPNLCKTMADSHVPNNVTIENLAISNEEGYADLRMPISRESGVANLGEATISQVNSFKSETYSGCEKIQIRCISLDDLVANKYSNWNVVAIKIDVEGHEGQVIESASKTISKSLPILLIEMEYRHGANIEKIFDFIGAMDYEAFRITKSGYGLVSTKAGEISMLQSEERWKKKKQDLYSTDYVNNFFFIPRRMKPKLIEYILEEDQ